MRLKLIRKVKKDVQTGFVWLRFHYVPGYIVYIVLFNVTLSLSNVQRQHYLRRGGSVQPVKRHCGIAVSLRPGPPSPGS